jgi:hypothetical protein
VIRKLGCLSAFVMLAVLVVVGWFGYQVYLRVTDYRAIDARVTTLQTAWDTDAAALKAAAGGKGGVRPASLPQEPFLTTGTAPVQAYSGSGRALTLVLSVGVCDVPEYVVEVRESTRTVVVLAHPQTSWLPAFHGFSGSCTSQAVALDVPVALVTPLGSKVVVDGFSGGSVPRR